MFFVGPLIPLFWTSGDVFPAVCSFWLCLCQLLCASQCNCNGNIRVFSKVFTVITVISQINASATENSW